MEFFKPGRSEVPGPARRGSDTPGAAGERLNFGPKSFEWSLKSAFFEQIFAFLWVCYIFALPFLRVKHMYAIVDIAGKQFKVAKDQYVYAPLLDGEAGASLNFDKVLLIDNDGSIDVGAPTVAGASVSGKILEHVQGNKVIVFKKKRRKGYAVKNGHRQQFTKLLIEGISR
jgi:large subunit ribosomal protein L21